MKFQAAAIDAMRAKDWDRAAELLLAQVSFQDKEPWPCGYLAAVFCQLGKPEEAIKQLKESHRRGYRGIQTLKEWPLLKGLHGRPDFERLLCEISPQASGPMAPR